MRSVKEQDRRLALQTNTNRNIAPSASVKLKDSGINFDEAPMLPEERRAKIAERYKAWQEQHKAVGDDIPDEEVEAMIDRELKETIG